VRAEVEPRDYGATISHDGPLLATHTEQNQVAFAAPVTLPAGLPKGSERPVRLNQFLGCRRGRFQ